jgi:hypothetical protein
VPGAEFRRMSVASHRPRSLLHTERNRLSLRSPNHPARLHHYTARPTTADMSIPLIDLRGVSITRYPSVAQLPRSPFSPTRQASPMSAQANPNPNPNPFRSERGGGCGRGKSRLRDGWLLLPRRAWGGSDVDEGSNDGFARVFRVDRGREAPPA